MFSLYIECTGDLGAGSGVIPNKAMTASTNLGPGYQAWLARLYNPHGAWCSATNDGDQYLQIQFPQVRKVRQLGTQGSVVNKGWVARYSVNYSQNGEEWKEYTNLKTVEVSHDVIKLWFGK